MTFDAIGTRWQIDLPDTLAQTSRGERLLTHVRERLEAFEAIYSRFRPTSLVSEMAARAGDYPLDEDGVRMMDAYRRLYQLTGGAFTPLIGQTLVDAGYDATYSLTPRTVLAPPAWEDALDYHPPTLTLKRPVQLDFGGVGKGYAIDLVAQLLVDEGVPSFVIDAGGDIVHRDETGASLRVGLEHPADPTQAIGVATIANQSICGSAGSRRAWRNFHHIINPHSLASPRHILATWAVANTAFIADAIATCLFLAPPGKLKDFAPFEYLILYADFSVDHSPGFPAEIFTS